RNQVLAVLEERPDAVDLDADRIAVPPGRMPGHEVGGYGDVGDAAPPEQDVRARGMIVPAHQAGEVPIPGRLVQADRRLRPLRRRAVLGDRHARALADAHLERVLTRDRPLLGGPGDVTVARLPDPVLPLLVNLVPKHVA